MILEVTGSTASKGSSRNSTCGLGSSAMAKLVFLRMPCEQDGGEGVPAVLQAQSVQQLARCGRCVSCAVQSVDRAGEQQVLFHRKIVEQAQDLPAARRFAASVPADCAAASSPHTSTVPEVGGSRPVSIFTVVDFPAPFGPRKTQIAPASTSRFRPSTAVKSP